MNDCEKKQEREREREEGERETNRKSVPLLHGKSYEAVKPERVGSNSSSCTVSSN